MAEKLINHNLLLDRRNLNSFTQKLKEILESDEQHGCTLVVRSRDSHLMEVEKFVDDEDSVPGFEGSFGTRHMSWYCDGSSITSRDYDIIEIIQ